MFIILLICCITTAKLFIITSISLTIMSKEKFSTTSVLEKIEEEKVDLSEPSIPKSD